MSLSDAFNSLLRLKRRKVLLARGNTSYDTYVTPSNYIRNASGPSEIIVEGRQFIISTKDLKAPILVLRRGDTITDPVLGRMSVDTIEEMYSLGSEIVGFRITTS